MGGFGGEDRSDDAKTISTGFDKDPRRLEDASCQTPPAPQVPPIMSKSCVSPYRSLSPVNGRVVTSALSSPVGVQKQVCAAPMTPPTINRGRTPAVWTVSS